MGYYAWLPIVPNDDDDGVVTDIVLVSFGFLPFASLFVFENCVKCNCFYE